jgi:hypothetical protein
VYDVFNLIEKPVSEAMYPEEQVTEAIFMEENVTKPSSLRNKWHLPEEHTSVDFYSTNLLTQQSTGRHVTPLSKLF